MLDNRLLQFSFRVAWPTHVRKILFVPAVENWIVVVDVVGVVVVVCRKIYYLLSTFFRKSRRHFCGMEISGYDPCESWKYNF